MGENIKDLCRKINCQKSINTTRIPYNPFEEDPNESTPFISYKKESKVFKEDSGEFSNWVASRINDRRMYKKEGLLERMYR